MCVIYTAHLIVLDLITVKLFGVKNKLRSSSLCNFLHPLVICFLLR